MTTEANFPQGAGPAATARVHSRASTIQVETLKAIAVFCGVGLVVSLLLATNGLDMSVGFF